MNIDNDTKNSVGKINNKIKIVPGRFMGGLLSFLKEYSVIGLAIGLIIGQASKDLVDSIVNGLFMPLIQLIVSKESFESMTFMVKGVVFDFGKVLSSLLIFLIIMTLLYLIIKKIIKNDKLLHKK